MLVSECNRKRVLRFCGAYVAVHLTVALFSIRFWPFTDYPMFSDPVYRDDEISVYRYYAVKDDGSTTRLKRVFANGYGFGELNLSKLLREGDRASAKSILSTWWSSQQNRDEIAAVRVTKVTAHRPDEKVPELTVDEDFVLEISSRELR